MRSLAAVLIVGSMAVGGQTPVRDPSTQSRSGTAVIAGVVVDDLGVAIARAVVAVANVGNTIRLIGATDDTGRFAFGQLPAGQYGLAASFSGYVASPVQIRRAGSTRVSSVLPVSERERITDITVTLVRGARIEGQVIDEDSTPLPGVPVRAILANSLAVVAGVPMGAGATTDRAGRFRIAGLAAGEYVVSALRADQGAMTLEDAGGSQRSVRFLETFHPGTVRQADAITVIVGAGDVRAGINVVIRPTAVTSITGMGILPDGSSIALVTADLFEPDRVARLMTRIARNSGGGQFVFDGVPAGRYDIAARATAATEMGPRSSPESGTWFATATVVTDGARPLEVPVQLAKGARVSARVVFDSRAALPQENVLMLPGRLHGPQGSPFLRTWAATGGADSRSIAWLAIPPGQYVFGSDAQPGFPRGEWFCTSVLVDGVEFLDVPLEIASGQHISNVVMRFTDAPAEISGVIRDASGAPIAGGSVLFVPADRRYWAVPGGRLRVFRAAADGRYVARGLPPGEYFAIALADLPPRNWADAAWWQARTGTAARATVADGEQKALNLTIR